MGLILKIVPWWAYICVGLFAWGAWGHYKDTEYKKERADIALEAQRMLNRAESDKAQANQQVDARYVTQIHKISTANASLRASVSKLRNDIAAINSSAASAPASFGVDAERANTYGQLSSECSGLLAEGAARVGQLTAKITALQNYAASVCVKK